MTTGIDPEVQRQDAFRDLAIRQRKPQGSDPGPRLPPGGFPHIPGGYVWDADRSPPPPVEQDG